MNLTLNEKGKEFLKKDYQPLSKKERQAFLLLEMVEAGIIIDPSQEEELKKRQFLTGSEIIPARDIEKRHGWESKRAWESKEIKRNRSVYEKTEIEADEQVTLFIDDVLMHSGVQAKDIKKADWDITGADKLDLPESFCQWVDSINSGWKNKKRYEPFEKYKLQSDIWMSRKYDISNYTSTEAKIQFITEEARRIKQNSLYFICKYGRLKEGDTESGNRKIIPYESQKVICYIFDMGLSLMVLKLRQVGASSIIGLLALKKAKFFKSYFIKFITENDVKVKEIFEDKIKYPLGRLPEWQESEVSSDSASQLKFGSKPEKGKSEGLQSKVVTEAPYPTAINGGSPQLVLIDEAGNIPIISKMIMEGRPTLFWIDPYDGLLKMKRQLVVWGTGGEMEKGGGAYEQEWNSCIDAWSNRNKKYGIIPLFLDKYAKDGNTDAFLESEKQIYYSKKGIEGERSKIQYHQHYPSNMADCFLRNSETLIDIATLNTHLDRINQAIKEGKVIKYGYFKPIFDTSKGIIDEQLSDTPYPVTGSEFVPVNDSDIGLATSVIIDEPEPGWQHRYYEGVDPISTASGTSNFAAVIYDTVKNTIPCIVDFRVTDYKYCYLQGLLAMLYYDKKGKILVENNIGNMFKDYVIAKGYRGNMVYNASLPLYLQTQQTAEVYGINNKLKVGQHIIMKFIEFADAYLQNVYADKLFIQLKHFVKRDIKDGAQATYKTENYKYYQDDVIFATAFAYICALTFIKHEPISPDKAQKKLKKKFRYMLNDSGHVELREIMV